MDKDPIAIVADITAAMENMKADHQKVVSALKEATEKTGNEAKEAAKAADDLAKKVQAQADSILDLEQKLADRVQKGQAAVETLGQIIVKSDAFKQFASGTAQKARIEANTITGQSGSSPPVNSDTLVPAQRMSGIVPGASRALRVADILPAGTTTSNAIEFTRENTFTNAAVEVAEADNKPQSTITFTLVSTPIRTIATFLRLSKQILDDSSALQAYVDQRLTYMVDYRWDAQLLNGNGTGQNISGITGAGNFTAFTPETGENALDSINRAIYAVYGSDYAPNAIILNPADWGAIERIKVGTSDVRYVVGNPVGSLMPTLWGLPVIVTNAQTAGSFVVGAFDIAYMAFTRQGTVVEMFEQDADNVTKNLVTVRAEKRGALASLRPASVRSGLLTI